MKYPLLWLRYFFFFVTFCAVSIRAHGVCTINIILPSADTTVCPGSSVTLKFTNNLGASDSAFLFKTDSAIASNKIAAQKATNDTLSFTFSAPGAAGSYKYFVIGHDAIGNCGFDTIRVIVNPALTPTVSIAAVPSGAICAGTSVTFTATAANSGGGTINYNFKKNLVSVQNGASTIFTTTVLANGDNITCDITVTGGTCLTSTTATSNTITMVVNANLTPAVLIAAVPAGAICIGITSASGGLLYS